MTDFTRLQNLYEAVSVLPMEQRKLRLDEICGEEGLLRREIESLLAVDRRNEAWLDQPPWEQASLVGQSIGRFQVIEELGSGGMGRVYLAREENPVRRLVALKFVALWGLNEEGRRRFKLEQSILARLNHSYIAKLYEAAATADGQPYFVMEYLEGETITGYSDRKRLDLAQRIELFEGVCQGVAHAHLKGVIHRDIKPSNILIIEEDGRAIPKIIDFGIAKSSEDAHLTTVGYVPGTLTYMSPEQTAPIGDGGENIDIRSDVYSLGVVLYELLVGEPPLHWPNGALPEKIRTEIRERVPKKPSALWRELSREESRRRADRRMAAPQAVTRALAGDLDWILMTALDKDPNRRYRSPQDLIQEFRRWRDHRPVEAGPPSFSYLLRKFLNRHRVAVSLALTGLILMMGFALYAFQQKTVIARERDTARRETESSNRTLDFLTAMIRNADPQTTAGGRISPVTLDEMLDKGIADLQEAFPDQPAHRTRLLRIFGETYRNRGRYEVAINLYSEALEIQGETQGVIDANTIADTHDLGWTHLLKGDLDQAEFYLTSALAAQRKSAGESDEATLHYMNTQIELYLEHGAYVKAKPLAEQTLAMGVEHHGRFSENAGRAHNSLGRIHSKLGDFDEAVYHYKKALEVAGALFGENHPNRSDVLHNLGRVLIEQGDFDGAMTYLKKAASLDRKFFGEDHPAVISDRQTLARLYFQKGAFAKAEDLYGKVIVQMRQQFGNGHPNLATALENLGRNAQFLGKPEQGRPMLHEAVAIKKAVYGNGHPSHVRALIYLGDLLMELGEFEWVVTLNEEALEMGGNSLEAPALEYYLVMSQKGRGLAGLGQLEAAEELLLPAFAGVLAGKSWTCYFEERTLDPIIALYETHSQALNNAPRQLP